MKNIIIKSGGYRETPGIAVAGAINDVHPFDIGQFHKSDLTFRLDLINGEYVIYLSHPGQQGNGFTQLLDMNFLTNAATKKGFAYFGVVAGDKAVLTNADMMRMMTTVIVNDKGEFVDANTDAVLPGNNIIPILYCMQMADNTFAVVLSSLTRIDTFLANDEDGIIEANDGFNTIVVNDGASMRDQFIDFKFGNVRKAFRNNDLVTGYALYAERNEIVTIDLFKNAPFVTQAMKDALKPSVDSNFQVELDGDCVVLYLPSEPEAMHGWLSIELPVSALYKEFALREIKETVVFDFMIFVL